MSSAAAEEASSSDNSIVFRPLAESDFAKGYCKLLEQLTVVGNITEQKFKDQYNLLVASGLVHIVVGEFEGSVVAAATLLVEPKFVHECGFVGHIEDVVVDKSMRGKKLGERVIKEALRVAEAKKCYKVILDCSENNAGFYEKCGFKKKELQMRIDLPAAVTSAAPVVVGGVSHM